ncbi:MAG: GlmL-related ornithine degradation protein [Bacillota bacterium]
MKVDVLVAEIGSTTTVVNAFDRLDSDEPRYLGQAMSATTVEEGDVLEGLHGAVRALRHRLGADRLDWEMMLASSSAAGGLRMTVHGLVYDMTVKAANEAALGAGAVVKMVTAGDLTEADLNRLKQTRPNIILLAGGVDYGEKNTAIGNARRLAELDLDVPIIFAGNVACTDEIRDILSPTVHLVDNVYPRIDQLNVEPTRRVIQDVFESHIVTAPGMGRVREMVEGSLMPTPGAVMEAAKVLYEVVGDLMVLDVGGATTDVHSVTAGSEEISRMLIAPEPVAKRTVEGDLGVYVNAGNLVNRIGEEDLSDELGFPVRRVMEHLPQIPENQQEIELVTRLTREAAEVAVSRHAGRLRHLYGPTGRSTVAEGKDLTQVRWVIGTGGALTRLPGGCDILTSLCDGNEPLALYPREARALVDRQYTMASLGVLSRRHPEAARRLLTDSLCIES